jgi:hypothetical protein
MMRASYIVLSSVLSSLFVLASSSVALAQKGKGGATSKEKAAKKACITGDVRKGIDILGDLYVDTNEINYVFNQARCYQQNHRWEEALDRFSEFMRKATKIPDDLRADLERHIADCKSHLPATLPATTAATQTQPAPATQPIGKEPSPAPSHVPPEGVAVAATPLSDGSSLRMAGLVVGAVGVAAIVTGVVLDLKTHSIVDDYYSKGYDSDKESSRKSYVTWGWVSYGVGAAGIVAGTTMYLLGWSAKNSNSTVTHVSLLPAFGPEGAALILRGGL